MSSTNSLPGIDVSHFQGTVDWTAVKTSGIVFAFAKASEGATNIDPQFAMNWENMIRAGIIRGAYHFYDTNIDPIAQANHFVSTVGALADNDLPPVVDIEAMKGNYGNLSVSDNLQVFLDTVERGLGKKPIIYTCSSFWNANMTGQFSNYPLWIANYEVEQPTLPHSWSNWTFWQYSEAGKVDGVNVAVDADYFSGSMIDLIALINQS